MNMDSSFLISEQVRTILHLLNIREDRQPVYHVNFKKLHEKDVDEIPRI